PPTTGLFKAKRAPSIQPWMEAGRRRDALAFPADAPAASGAAGRLGKRDNKTGIRIAPTSTTEKLYASPQAAITAPASGGPTRRPPGSRSAVSAPAAGNSASGTSRGSVDIQDGALMPPVNPLNTVAA